MQPPCSAARTSLSSTTSPEENSGKFFSRFAFSYASCSSVCASQHIEVRTARHCDRQLDKGVEDDSHRYFLPHCENQTILADTVLKASTAESAQPIDAQVAKVLLQDDSGQLEGKQQQQAKGRAALPTWIMKPMRFVRTLRFTS